MRGSTVRADFLEVYASQLEREHGVSRETNKVGRSAPAGAGRAAGAGGHGHRPAPAARILQDVCNRFFVLEDPPGRRNAISMYEGCRLLFCNHYSAPAAGRAGNNAIIFLV